MKSFSAPIVAPPTSIVWYFQSLPGMWLLDLVFSYCFASHLILMGPNQQLIEIGNNIIIDRFLSFNVDFSAFLLRIWVDWANLVSALHLSVPSDEWPCCAIYIKLIIIVFSSVKPHQLAHGYVEGAQLISQTYSARSGTVDYCCDLVFSLPTRQ